MSKEFPHLNDTKFPDLQTANVYKYRNELDYDAYEASTKIKLLNVPWCGDYDNAVYFESKEERDNWFDSQRGEVREMPTMFRLYADGDIKVELPIDECMGYNYAMIDYGKAPYQSEESKYSKMFYFISDMSQDSVNTTRLRLSVDYWTTYIYDMGITYVNLERGHAPMALADADTYLDNPLDNSEFLLTDDVSYGYLQRVTSTENVIFNDYTGDLRDMTLGFQTSASMESSWSVNGNPRIPTAAFESSQAFSSVDPFVIEDLTLWESFRDTVVEQCPQFFETVKGMFIVPKKLLTYSTDFEFCGFRCHFLASHGDKLQGGIKLEKGMFGYPDEFSDIAKLYTYPYAAIEVTDFKGGTMQIRIEDTAGSVEVRTMMCDMYPFLGIESYLTGIGSSGRSVLAFQNNFTHTMTIGGRYYDFSTKWSIPVFSVQLTAQADWELNGKIGAEAALSNTQDNAQLTRDNAAVNVSTNTANTGLANTMVEDNKSTNNILSFQHASIGNNATRGTANATIQADNAQAAVTTLATSSTAAVNAASGIAGGAVSGALNGGPMGAAAGAVGGIIGAVSGLLNASISCSSTLEGTAISNGLRSDIAGINTQAVNDTTVADTQANTQYAANQIAYNSGTNTNSNNYIATASNNSATVMEDNATRSYNAQYYQKQVSNHPAFGQLTGTPDIISKPFGLSFNAVTQSRNAIRQAAEQFMRYGYALNMQWKLSSFNVMPRFSYWKCSSVYCDDSGIYEGGQAMVKSILEQGVTVWRKPEDIGVISIYENKAVLNG